MAAAGLVSACLSLGLSTVVIMFALTGVTVAILVVSLLDERGAPTVAAVVEPVLSVSQSLCPPRTGRRQPRVT